MQAAKGWRWAVAGMVLAAGWTTMAMAADETVTELGEVLVTAQRYATPELTTPSYTTVISGDELARSGGRTVTEALRATGGLDYTAYSPLGINQGGMNSELPVRGIPDGELVLIDGLPLQNPSGGNYDLNTIPLAAIERVEIVKGSASTLYGSAAMTGVINIITKKPQGRQVTLQSEAGNNAYVRSNITVGAEQWLAAFTHTHLGAVDRVATSYTSFWEYDQMPTDDYGALVRVSPLAGLTVGWLGSQEQTGFVRNPWPDKPLRAANGPKGTVQESNRNLTTVQYEQAGFSLAGAYLSDLMWYQVDDGTGLNATDFFRWSVNPQYHGTLATADYLIGGEWQSDLVKSSAYGARRRQSGSVYGTATVHPWEPLAVTLGGRHQWVLQKDAADYSTFTPQAQASFQLNDELAVYANAGRAFRAPDLTRLYRSTALVRGNPDLKPEQGWTYEGGVKYRGDWISATVAAFLMRYKDKIDFDRSRGNPLTYYNTGYWQSRGIEWELGVTPHEHWTVGVNGCYAEPEAGNAQNQVVQTGAGWQLAPAVSFDNGTVNARAGVTMLMDRQNSLGDFVSADVTLGIALPGGLGEFTVAVTNLLDRENSVAGELTPSSASRYEYFELGRTVRAGLRFDF